MKKWSTRTIIFMGLMAAINIILTRFLSLQISDSIRITLGNLPIILTGAILGPLPAVLVAFVGDFAGCMFFSGYAWFPPVTLAPMIIGGWTGLFSKQMCDGKLLKIMLVCLSGSVLGSVLYNTYCLSILYGSGFWPLLIARAPIQLLTAAANALVCHALLKSPVARMIKQGDSR